jgi:AhpD family alkylhydroperoxidase
MRLDYMNLSAAGMRAFGGVHVYLGNSGLPHDLIDLVYLRASQINGCAYCLFMHAADARAEGEAPERLDLLNA